ncbi:MAG: DNA-binding protein [Pseudonocardiales bacterium]|nr:MAG: DNA-binding protein [Pseudonocardiales bacterium]
MKTQLALVEAQPGDIDLTRLPPTVDILTAARILGVGRTVAYELVREGAWPTPVIHVGRKIRVPTAPLLGLLGVRPPVA